MRTTTTSILALLCVQLGLFALAWPVGDFPLNDDWVYAHSVLWLVREHRFALSDWIVTNLLPQTLLGWGASLVAGYSFTTLRAVTQLVSLATGVAALQFFRACGLPLRKAFLAALALVCLPWWQVLASSDMSDMYGLFFGLLGARWLVEHLRTGSTRVLWLGALFAATAVLQRQVALTLPAAFAIACLCAGGWRSRQAWLAAMVPIAVCAAGQAAYQLYLTHAGSLPPTQQMVHGRLLRMATDLLLFKRDGWLWFGYNVAHIGLYLGLVLAAPLLVLPGLLAPRHRVLAAASMAAVLAGCLWAGWLPPYRENNLIDAAGIGPFTMADGMRSDAPFDRSRGGIWLVAAGLAAVGVVLAAAAFARVPRSVKGQPASVRVACFLATMLVAYLLPLAITDFFDRYLLFAFPFAIALAFMGLDTAPRGRALAAAAVLCIGVLSALGTHDYFAWNRARWAAVALAEGRLGAGPATLDAGYEYNGYENYERLKRQGSAAGKRWWWVQDDRLLVAFAPVPGYALVRRFPVDAWFRRGPQEVLLLQREAPR